VVERGIRRVKKAAPTIISIARKGAENDEGTSSLAPCEEVKRKKRLAGKKELGKRGGGRNLLENCIDESISEGGRQGQSCPYLLLPHARARRRGRAFRKEGQEGKERNRFVFQSA